MSTEKATPGKWRARKGFLPYVDVEVTPGYWLSVAKTCDTDIPRVVQEANRNLIAASPLGSELAELVLIKKQFISDSKVLTNDFIKTTLELDEAIFAKAEEFQRVERGENG